MTKNVMTCSMTIDPAAQSVYKAAVLPRSVSRNVQFGAARCFHANLF
jgi:hypothetical protein